MARIIADASQLHRVGLEDIVAQYNEGMTSYWKDIAPVSTSTNQAYIQFMQEGDFGMAPVVGENNPISDDDIFYGNLKTIAPIKRGLGFSISTEAQETDQYGRLTNIVPKIKLAFNKTREQASADRINNCTSTGARYVNPDGVALASASHTADGAVQSNLMVTAFGPTALETMVQNLILTKSHRGDPDPQMGPYDLMIHPSQNFLAERVLFSNGQQGTANNDANRIGKRIGKLISSPYFTSTTFFALRNSDKRQQPFAVLERRALKVKTDEDINNDVVKYRLTEIYAFYERGWRGFYHSTGAG
jgi:hypothetical protein